MRQLLCDYVNSLSKEFAKHLERDGWAKYLWSTSYV